MVKPLNIPVLEALLESDKISTKLDKNKWKEDYIIFVSESGIKNADQNKELLLHTAIEIRKEKESQRI